MFVTRGAQVTHVQRVERTMNKRSPRSHQKLGAQDRTQAAVLAARHGS
jgi:DNA-binding NarL/FixJ family response regulator